MSHLAKVNLKILDLTALQSAAEVIGLQWKADQKTYKRHEQWSGQVCEHAMACNDASAFEIGVCKAQDGQGYELWYDSWGPGQKLEAVAGKQLGKLRQEYSIQISTMELLEQGCQVDRIQLSNGQIQLVGVLA